MARGKSKPCAHPIGWARVPRKQAKIITYRPTARVKARPLALDNSVTFCLRTLQFCGKWWSRETLCPEADSEPSRETTAHRGRRLGRSGGRAQECAGGLTPSDRNVRATRRAAAATLAAKLPPAHSRTQCAASLSTTLAWRATRVASATESPARLANLVDRQRRGTKNQSSAPILMARHSRGHVLTAGERPCQRAEVEAVQSHR